MNLQTSEFTFITFAFLLLSTSCAEKQSKNFDLYDTKITILVRDKLQCENINQYRNLVICPIDGCPDCISLTIQEIKNELKKGNRNTLFIISGYVNKILSSRFSNEELKNENLLLDNQNYGYRLGVVELSPIWFKIKNGRILNSAVINPNNINQTFDALN